MSRNFQTAVLKAHQKCSPCFFSDGWQADPLGRFLRICNAMWFIGSIKNREPKVFSYAVAKTRFPNDPLAFEIEHSLAVGYKNTAKFEQSVTQLNNRSK